MFVNKMLEGGLGLDANFEPLQVFMAYMVVLIRSKVFCVLKITEL